MHIYITTKTYQVPCCFNVESYPYTFSDIWGRYRYTMYVSYMDDAWHCRNKVADSGWFHLRCVSILLCPRPVSALHQSHDPCKVGTKVARSRSQNKPQDSEQSPERQQIVHIGIDWVSWLQGHMTDTENSIWCKLDAIFLHKLTTRPNPCIWQHMIMMLQW
jgi:hypothetical protein